MANLGALREPHRFRARSITGREGDKLESTNIVKRDTKTLLYISLHNAGRKRSGGLAVMANLGALREPHRFRARSITVREE
jgi:hypothetical protein